VRAGQSELHNSAGYTAAIGAAALLLVPIEFVSLRRKALKLLTAACVVSLASNSEGMMTKVRDDDDAPEDNRNLINPTAMGAIEGFISDHPLGALIGAFVGGVLIAKLGLL
jgi:hypothetical protein